LATRKIQLPFGPATITDVDIVKRSEAVAEYELSDGSIVRVMNPVFGMVRCEGQFDQMGNPIYFVQNSVVTMTVSANDLMRKPVDGEKPN
jgi:hypothetical protein